MGNRTFESGLLIARNDATDALAGYAVIVHERLRRGGSLFVQLVDAQHRFAPSLFKKYEAWAVSKAPEFLTQATTRVKPAQRPHYAFDVIINIRYAARNAALIVELRETDPLDKVIENVKLRIAAELAGHDQQEIDENFRDLALASAGALMPQLKSHAETFGLTLLEIAIDPAWPEDVVKRKREREEADEKHAESLRALVREHVESTRKLENKRELGPLEEEVQDSEDRRTGNSALRNARVKGFITAIDQVSRSVEDVDDFAHAASVLKAIPGLSPGIGHPGPQPPNLLSDGSSESGSLRRLLDNAFTRIDHLPCNDKDKRRVNSHFLGLVSEALRDTPDHAAVESRRAALSTTLYEARPQIPVTEVQSWNVLTSLDRLREQLGLA